LCAIEAHTLAKKDMEVLKDEGKSESTKSDLDDMWYKGDKKVTYMTLKMKIGMTMKTSKKRQMQM
jgi:hypothetical protein